MKEEQNNEKYQAFRYDFTMKELIYFLFGKKTCPKCNGKLNKSKSYEIVDGKKFNSNSVPLYIQKSEVKHYLYTFTCEQCGTSYTLQELAEKKTK